MLNTFLLHYSAIVTGLPYISITYSSVDRMASSDTSREFGLGLDHRGKWKLKVNAKGLMISTVGGRIELLFTIWVTGQERLH